MNYDFTPTENENSLEVPYFEDATAGFAPYYSSTKNIQRAKSEVVGELAKLGAEVLHFIEGYFTTEKGKRYGYQISFTLKGTPGIIRVSGLPIRKLSDTKLSRVKVQALLNVRDWLKTSVTQMIFSPGSHPLLMNLLTDDGLTIGERIMERRLMLPDSIDGEFKEITK